LDGVNVGTQTTLEAIDITRTLLSMNIISDVIGQDNVNKVVENTCKINIDITK